MLTPIRSLVAAGLLCGLAGTSSGALARAERRDGRGTQAWAATVVNRIARADLATAGAARGGGTVTVRLRIAADGGLGDAAIEGGSGSTELAARALAAVKAAAPFPPPPRTIVTLEGYTELSFPLELDGTAR